MVWQSFLKLWAPLLLPWSGEGRPSTELRFVEKQSCPSTWVSVETPVFAQWKYKGAPLLGGKYYKQAEKIRPQTGPQQPYLQQTHRTESGPTLKGFPLMSWPGEQDGFHPWSLFERAAPLPSPGLHICPGRGEKEWFHEEGFIICYLFVFISFIWYVTWSTHKSMVSRRGASIGRCTEFFSCSGLERARWHSCKMLFVKRKGFSIQHQDVIWA